MRMLFFILFFCGICSTLKAKELIYQCGNHCESPFNGWKIYPYQAFDDISYENNELSFYRSIPGEYTIELVRKLDDLIGYSDFIVNSVIECNENASLENVDISFSTDGINWMHTRPEHSIFSRKFHHENMDLLFVKASLHTRFYRNGRVSFTSFSIEGDFPNEAASSEAINTAESNEEITFHIFSHNGRINVETQSEAPYEIFITNLAGQVVFKSTETGSTLVQTDLETGIYILSIVQDNKLKTSKKIAL